MATAREFFTQESNQAAATGPAILHPEIDYFLQRRKNLTGNMFAHHVEQVQEGMCQYTCALVAATGREPGTVCIVRVRLDFPLDPAQPVTGLEAVQLAPATIPFSLESGLTAKDVAEAEPVVQPWTSGLYYDTSTLMKYDEVKPPAKAFEMYMRRWLFERLPLGAILHVLQGDDRSGPGSGLAP